GDRLAAARCIVELGPQDSAFKMLVDLARNPSIPIPLRMNAYRLLMESQARQLAIELTTAIVRDQEEEFPLRLVAARDLVKWGERKLAIESVTAAPRQLRESDYGTLGAFAAELFDWGASEGGLEGGEH